MGEEGSKRVGVVTDSTAALPAEVASAHDVRVVPMRLSLNGPSYTEADVSRDDVLSAETVLTSGPVPGDFISAAQDSDRGAGTVVLTVSSAFSSTHRAALVATQQITGDTKVLDTRTFAGAQGLVVLAAAEAARSGAPLPEE